MHAVFTIKQAMGTSGSGSHRHAATRRSTGAAIVTSQRKTDISLARRRSAAHGLTGASVAGPKKYLEGANLRSPWTRSSWPSTVGKMFSTVLAGLLVFTSVLLVRGG